MENQNNNEEEVRITDETKFANAKAGDKVWSIIYGWGKIVNVEPIAINTLPIKVEYPTRGTKWYRLGGNSGNGGQELFWNEIKFDIPTRPKRLVTKEKIMYCNVYADDKIQPRLYSYKPNCIIHSGTTAIAKGVEVIIRYQVEE